MLNSRLKVKLWGTRSQMPWAKDKYNFSNEGKKNLEFLNVYKMWSTELNILYTKPDEKNNNCSHFMNEKTEGQFYEWKDINCK